MIKKEIIYIGGRELVRTYSDEGFHIQKVGTDEVYSDAVDIPENGFEYVETEEKIEVAEDNAEVTI